MLPVLENETLVSLIVLHLLVSIRFLGLLLTASVFLLPSFPNPARFWLSVILAVAAAPMADQDIPSVLLSGAPFIAVMGAREFIIGAAIGFVSSLPLYAMQISGYLDSTVMGFNMMNMFDPMSSAQTSVLAQLKYLLAIWFFLRWDGHILLVQALSESFKLLPVGSGMRGARAELPWISWLQRAFVIALRVSLPLFGAILLAEVGLGFVARTVPQMNVFVLGIPIKICMGFFLLLTLLPASVEVFHTQIERAVRWALEGIYYWR